MKRIRLLSCLLVLPCTFVLWFICFVNPFHFQKVQFFMTEGPARSIHAPLTNLTPNLRTRTGYNYPNTLATDTLSQSSALSQSQQSERAQPDPDSLTAILPVTISTLLDIETVLSPFLRPSAHLREVIVICPDSVVVETRRQLWRTVAAASEHDHPDFSLRPWTHGMDQTTAVFRASSHVTTQWVLLLDDKGLQQLDNRTQDLLFAGRTTHSPVGPSGMDFWRPNISCNTILHPALPFLPPVVLPTILLSNYSARSVPDIWAHLRERLLEWLPVENQGNTTSLAQSGYGWCFSVTDAAPSVLNDSGKFQVGIGDNMAHISNPFDHAQLNDATADFLLLLPSLRDLELMSSVPCKLLNKGYRVQILLTNEVISKEHTSNYGGCRLGYDLLSSEVSPATSSRYGQSLLLKWLDNLQSWPNVVFTLTEDFITMDLALTLQQHRMSSTSVVRITRADLPYCFWMGTLSIEEWKNWNLPRIDVSVITKDRPHSLRRLLSSLSNSRYFGDTLTLRVNLEQSSDIETMKMVENFRWEHGDVFVHHRVIHGGLLPAVVESWYPQSNHTYGLLLEDDVELSPLFYAWVKMSILRYRYGEEVNRSPQLFGISLYQQKILELRPEGRRSFDARTLFSSHGLPATMPYLSQIPCSWGAVYFPQHWKEFHAYLSWRLSEFTIKITENVVPDVRSNKWTKSWKKYFIELAYLRGYVMLYPNYDGFISLSTNHLEVGSHVKDRSKEKKEQFVLPLMELPTSDQSTTGLLDLPKETLPCWGNLPILNLTGSVTSLEALIHVGLLRRSGLSMCASNTSAPSYDVRDLACISVDNFP